MKRCDNCFEENSDGATNCVICGESLAVPQSGEPVDSSSQLSQFDESYDEGGIEEDSSYGEGTFGQESSFDSSMEESTEESGSIAIAESSYEEEQSLQTTEASLGTEAAYMSPIDELDLELFALVLINLNEFLYVD